MFGKPGFEEMDSRLLHYLLIVGTPQTFKNDAAPLSCRPSNRLVSRERW